MNRKGNEDAEDNDAQIEQNKVIEPKFVSRNTIKNVNLNKIIINISDCQYPVVRTVAKSMKWKVQTDSQGSDWDVWWTDNAIPPETLFRMLPHQKINHFPGMHVLARKNLLGKGLMRMRKQFSEEYSFFPMTWMLPSQYSQFRLYYESKPKGKGRTYIVKPQALSQGKGIFLTRRIEDIPLGQHCVIQRYLHKPYLIDGLKFDFRIYVLLTSVDPMRVYLYHEGLARFATEPYIVPTYQNMDDVCMHLTNYAINKDNPKFVFNKSQKDMSVGHKRSLASVFKTLEEQGVDIPGLKFKIKQIIIKTLICGYPYMKHQYRSCQVQNFSSNMCFQILGFDIMLTDKAEPQLLQVNHTPSFVTDTPLDETIKLNLIKDSLILMNINTNVKGQLVSSKKEEINKKVLNIKKPKLSQEQKDDLRFKAQKAKDLYEQEHCGGFEKIYPVAGKNPYDKFIQTAQKQFDESQGIRRKTMSQTESNRQQTSKKKTTTKKALNWLQQKQEIWKLKTSKLLGQNKDSWLPYLKMLQQTSCMEEPATNQLENLLIPGTVESKDIISQEHKMMLTSLNRRLNLMRAERDITKKTDMTQYFSRMDQLEESSLRASPTRMTREIQPQSAKLHRRNNSHQNDTIAPHPKKNKNNIYSLIRGKVAVQSNSPLVLSLLSNAEKRTAE